MGASFAKFMASVWGRLIRIAAGFTLMAAGFYVGGTGGIALALVGLVPAAAGAFNFCLISPFIHAPFWGRQALGPKT